MYFHRTAIENTSNVCDSVYLKKAGAVKNPLTITLIISFTPPILA